MTKKNGLGLAPFWAGQFTFFGPHFVFHFLGPIHVMSRFVIPETNFQNSKFTLGLPRGLNINDFLINIVILTEIKIFPPHTQVLFTS